MGTYHGYFGKWAAFTKLTSESLPINPQISAALQPHCFYLFLCSGQWLMQNVTLDQSPKCKKFRGVLSHCLPKAQEEVVERGDAGVGRGLDQIGAF